MRRTLALAAAVATAAMLAALPAAVPAAAHGDEGVMTIIDTVPDADGRTVRIEVGIEFEGDGHLAEEAEVTVTGTGPEGAALAATPLAHESGGRYAGTVVLDAPGTWNLQVTSTNPTSSAAVDVVVDDPEGSTTTSAPGTTSPVTTASTASTASTAPEGPDATATTVPGDTEPADDDTPVVWILSAIGLLTLVAFGVALYLRGRRLRREADDAG